MSSEKFTPGPWDGKSISVHSIFFEKLKISLGFASRINDEVKANSNLIAAAPEMYEALKELVEIAKPHIYPQPDKPNSNWAKLKTAEAALAKSRGEQ